MALVVVSLGLPLARPGHLWLLFVGLPLLVLGRVRSDRRRWMIVATLCVLAGGARTMLGPGEIRVRANVFSPGNEQLASILPPAALEAATRAYRQRYGNHDLALPRAVSRGFDRWDFHSDVTFRRRLLSVDSLQDWPLGAVNTSPEFNVSAYNRDLRSRPDPGRREFERRSMPYFAIADFAPRHAGRSLCYRGHVFVSANGYGDFRDVSSPGRRRCIELPAPAADAPVRVVGFQTGPGDELALDLEATSSEVVAELVLRRLLPLIAAMLAIGALLDPRSLPRGARIYVALLITISAAAVIEYRVSELAVTPLGTFVAHRAGADGLTHTGFGRHIANALVDGRIGRALEGMEPVYYFQPGFRYIRALDLLIFGPGSTGPLLLVSLTGVAVLCLSRRILPGRGGIAFVTLWLVPVLPFLDTAARYWGLSMPVRTDAPLVPLLHWGIEAYSEPAGLLFALVGAILCFDILTDPQRSAAIYALAGSALALSTFVRCNWSIVALVLLVGAALAAARQDRTAGAATMLGVYSGLVAVMPIHNYWFGGDLVLFTSSLRADIVWTVTGDTFRAALALQEDALATVIDHLGLLFTEGRLVVIGACLVAVAARGTPFSVRVFAAAALAGFAPYLVLRYASRFVILPDILGALVLWHLLSRILRSRGREPDGTEATRRHAGSVPA